MVTTLCVGLLGLLTIVAPVDAAARRVQIGTAFPGTAGTLTFSFITAPDPLPECNTATNDCMTPVCSVDVDCDQVDAVALATALENAINAASCSGISAALVDNPEVEAEFDVFFPDGLEMCIADTAGGQAFPLRKECTGQFICGFNWVFDLNENDPPQPACLDVEYCTSDDPEGAACVYEFTVENCGGTNITTFYLDVEAGDGGPVTPGDPLADVSLPGWTPSLCFGWSETETRAHAILCFTKDSGSLAPGLSVTGTLTVNASAAQQSIPGTAHVVPAGGIHTHVTFNSDTDLGVSCLGGTFGPHLAGQEGDWSAARDAVCGATGCGPRRGDVIITEIMYDPASIEYGPPNFESPPEWIELYNPTNRAIDLTGFYIEDGDLNRTDGTDSDPPCTLERTGPFPSFVLQPGRLVIVIPQAHPATTNPPPSVADFKAAWGLGEDCDVIQLEPGGTSEGQLAGDNLGNAPTNNPPPGFGPTDDIPLLPPHFNTCDAGQPEGNFEWGSSGTASNDEILTIYAPDGTLIDQVNYAEQVGGTWPPASGALHPNGVSITLVPRNFADILANLQNPPAPDISTYNTNDNNDGNFWKTHKQTVNAQVVPVLGAYELPNPVGAYGNGTIGGFRDIGSPCFLWGVTLGNQPPSARSVKVLTNPGETESIVLEGSDDGDGNPPGTLNFVIDTLPVNGELRDVANNNQVINSVPHVLAGNEVSYTNDGTCGDDPFTFHATDGELDSGTSSVTLVVQCGQLVITEIMYDPNSNEVAPKVVEWIEVYNPGAAPLDVGGWRVGDRTGRTGMFPAGTTIPTGGVAVIIAGGGVDANCTFTCPTTDCTEGNRTFTSANFEAAWGTMPQVIQPEIFPISCDTLDNSFGELGNGGLVNSPPAGGEELHLLDNLGRVQDMVSYEATSPWPSGTGRPAGSSIYLEGPPSNYTAAANDDGSAWAGSMLGDASGAYNNLIVGPFDGGTSGTAVDAGSPGFLSGVSAGNTRPAPKAKLNTMQKNDMLVITLDAVDSTPTGTLIFVIQSLPVRDFAGGSSAGTLTDPNGNGPGIPRVLSQGDLPWPLGDDLDSVPGRDVIYTPTAGLTGAMAFTFSVDDGDLESGPAKERIAVQDTTVYISEVMFDPRNSEPAFEWIEIVNPAGGSPVTVSSIRAGRPDTIGTVDLANTSDLELQPGERWLLVNANSTVLFATEWAPINMAFVQFVPNTSWEPLAQPTTSQRQTVVRLFDSGNGLIDQVIYEDNTGGWPNFPAGGPSVYLREALKPGGETFSEYNDSGGSWAVSAAGCDGAYATDDADMVIDVGSPLIASTGTNTSDCNANGVPDNCDIDLGTLTDNDPPNGIPDECEQTCATCRGDMNGDGDYNGDDVNPFVDAYIAATNAPFVYNACADLNASLAINDADLGSFINLLLTGDTTCNVSTTTITKSGTTVADTLTLAFFESGDPQADPPEPAETCGVEVTCPPTGSGINVCQVSVAVSASDTAAMLATNIAAAVNSGTGDCFQRITANAVGATITFAHENPREKLTICLSTGTDTSPGMGYNLGGANACDVHNVLDGTAGNEGAPQGDNGFSFSKSSN